MLIKTCAASRPRTTRPAVTGAPKRQAESERSPTYSSSLQNKLRCLRSQYLLLNCPHLTQKGFRHPPVRICSRLRGGELNRGLQLMPI